MLADAPFAWFCIYFASTYLRKYLRVHLAQDKSGHISNLHEPCNSHMTVDMFTAYLEITIIDEICLIINTSEDNFP